MSDTLNLSTTRPGLLPLNLGERRFATGIPFQILVSFASSEDGKQKPALSKVEGTEIFSRLAHELESGKNLKQAFHHLNSTQQDSLREAIGRGTLAELLSLSQEGDKELLDESLLHFGIRLKLRSEFEKASVVLGLLSGGAAPLPPFGHPLPGGERGDQFPRMLEERAEEEYNSIVGKGDIGRRLEVLSSRLARDACDWRMIVPMIGASALGATVASSVLGRLVSNPIASGFTRGIGARFSAGAVGYLAEFPAFAALGRVMAENSEGRFVEDLERSALAIGALKVSGWIGQQVGALLAAPFWALRAQRAGQALPLQFLISQTSIFIGLLASHKLEEEFNLRPHVDGATFVTDTLASMFTMSVGSHLGHRVLGEGFQRFQQELHLRSEMMEKDPVIARSARSTQGRENHPSHPLLAALGTGLATYLGTHWAHAAWESAASDPSNFLLKTAALAIPAVVGMALSKKRNVKRPDYPQWAKLGPIGILLEISFQRIWERSHPLTERVDQIERLKERLLAGERNSQAIQEAVLALLDLAIDPGMPSKGAKRQYQGSPEDEVRILRTKAMAAAVDMLADIPLDKDYRVKIAERLERFLQVALPYLRYDFITAPADWPVQDPRFIPHEKLPKIQNMMRDRYYNEFGPFRNLPPTGALDVNKLLRELFLNLFQKLTPLVQRANHPLDDNSIPGFDELTKLKREDWKYWKNATEDVGFWSPKISDNLKETDFQISALLGGLFSLVGVPTLAQGALINHPQATQMGLIFSLLGMTFLMGPHLYCHLRGKDIRVRKGNWEKFFQENKDSLQSQLESGEKIPFAKLSNKFRIDGVEESGEPKTRVEDLDQWLAEVERRAEAEAEAEFQTDAKKISTPKPPDKK